MSAPLLAGVPDTARWVAYCRALESERPRALFRDPFARRLAGERGRAIAEGMPTAPGARPGPSGLSSVLAVRTVAFDEMILDSIQAIEADAVLNLAAGLDARPYRLSLPRSLVWLEADRSEILDAKAQVLAGERASCKVERIAVDLSDDQARRALLDRVAASHARVVVVTEGLLIYLDETVVARLAEDLRALIPMRKWVLESASPEALRRNMRAWGKVLAEGNAEWKFAPPNGFAFFQPHGWSLAIERPFFTEARRLGRDRELRFAWLVRSLSRLSPSFRKRLEGAVVYGVLEPSTVTLR